MLNNLLLNQTAAADPLYVEDVFSTYLYTGTGTTQTIVNDINLSTNGGLVWIKGRAATFHAIYDTARGDTFELDTTNAAQTTKTAGLTAFNTSGFTIGALAKLNTSAATYASWTFRKSAKFFDCVTWTGNGANRTIAHALGIVPGLIIVKRTDTASDWQVYHSSLANTEYLVLNTTAAKATGATRWNSTTPTATVFSLGTDATVNASGGTYVAYLFAHDTTADGIVQCGAFTSDASGNANVTIGWEPQFLLVKQTSGVSHWTVVDNMRGLASTDTKRLFPNLSSAEESISLGGIQLTPTGFSGGSGFLNISSTHIYLAIRRGPMRTPTDATKVFSPIATSSAAGTFLTTSFPIDVQMGAARGGDGYNFGVSDRLRGVSTTTAERVNVLVTNQTLAESTASNLPPTRGWTNNGFQNTTYYGTYSAIFLNFRRAPGFFDVVCYTGTGANTTVSHGLGVAPELIITKNRSTAATNWTSYHSALGNTGVLYLNLTNAGATATNRWNSTSPTSTTFSLGTATDTNSSGANFIAYLFASCPGVSKVGSYTGTGTTKQIDCGFTNGARFVLIKRTDSTGDWTIWDTARGIVSGNDPYLLLNSNAAEVTSTDYIDPLSTGFEISSTAPAAINANGGTFVFLAIA